jgi:hypothetical protein
MKAKILPVSLVLIMGAIGFMIGRNSGSRSETPTATSGGSSSRNLSTGGGGLESNAAAAKRSSGGSRGVTEKKSVAVLQPFDAVGGNEKRRRPSGPRPPMVAVR